MYHGPIPRSTFEGSGFFAKINEAVKNNKPVHLVPLSPNFEAIDSIVYHPKDPNLICILDTMNPKHPISVSDLHEIQEWLQLHALSAKLRSKKLKQWRFVFIIPQHMASTFKLQRFDNDIPEDAWARKVNQCMLGVEGGIFVFDLADSN